MDDFDSGQAGQLAALVALARYGTFTEAGRRLGRSPTVISKRIAAFEQRLGIRLVERTTRTVRLTETGAALAEQLAGAIDVITEAESLAAADAAAPRGPLRLALPGSMGRFLLSPLLPEFLAQYPGISFELDFSDRYVDLVAEGYDAALRVGHLGDSRLVARKLASHARILAAAPAWVRRHGQPERPEALDPDQVLAFTGFASDREWSLTDGSRRAAVRVGGRIRSNEMTVLLEAARAGLGIIGAGEWMLAPEFQAGRLVRVLPGWHFGEEGGIFLVRPSRADPPARVTAFADWIVAKFKAGRP